MKALHLAFYLKLYGGNLAVASPVKNCYKKETAEESQGCKKEDLVGLTEHTSQYEGMFM